MKQTAEQLQKHFELVRRLSPRARPAAPAKRFALAACPHLGAPTGREVLCGSCSKPTPKPVHACAIHGECTVDQMAKVQDRLSCCAACDHPDNPRRRTLSGGLSLEKTPPTVALPPAVPGLQRIVKLDLPNHFNCGLIEHGGKLLVASRFGWAGAKTFISELDASYRIVPGSMCDTQIKHRNTFSGAEDPRLFTFRGQLHAAVTGYEYTHKPRTSQLLALLDGDKKAIEVWCPHYDKRQAWEKNWAFFEHDQRLFCVYSFQPHVVLEMRGVAAVEHSRVAHRMHWPTWTIRGGAPPVRVGDEFYHWFHGVRSVGGLKEYWLGLYTFEAKPPFRPRRRLDAMVMTADEEAKGRLFRTCMFPCGAVLKSGQWIISYGQNDQECRLAFFDAQAIEKGLK